MKCWIVLDGGKPPRSHELDLLAREANLNLANLLLDLRLLCGESALSDRRFQPPTDRSKILEEVKRLADQVRNAIATQAKD